MSSSRFLLKDGTEVACADRWAEMLEPVPVEPASPWPEKSRTAHEVNIGSICKGIVEARRAGRRMMQRRHALNAESRAAMTRFGARIAGSVRIQNQTESISRAKTP